MVGGRSCADCKGAQTDVHRTGDERKGPTRGAVEKACQCSEPRNQTKIKGQSNPQEELKANIGRKRDGSGIKKLPLFSAALSSNDRSVGDCLRPPPDLGPAGPDPES